MPSRPVSNQTSSLRDSKAVRFALLGEGTRIERLSRLKRVWRVVRAHLTGEVPIEQLDLPGPAPLLADQRQSGSVRPERDATAEGDTTVDEASDESFPASDPPSFTASRV